MKKLSNDASFGYIVGFTKAMELFAQGAGHADGKQKRNFILDKMMPDLLGEKYTTLEIKRKIETLDLEHWEIAITNIMKNKMDRDSMLKAMRNPDSLFSALHKI
jgi:hypothetical protein